MIFNLLVWAVFIFSILFTIKNTKKSFLILISFNLVFPNYIATRMPFYMTLPRIYFIGFCLVYFMLNGKKVYSNMFKNKLLLVYSLYTTYLFLNMIINYSWENQIVFFSETVVGVWLILIISYDLINSSMQFFLLSKYICASISIIAVLGYFEAIFGLKISNLISEYQLTNLNKSDLIQFAGGNDFFYRGGFPRIESTFNHSIFLGIALTFLLPLFMLFKRDPRYKTIFNFTIILAVISAFLTFSRTAWLSIVIPLVLNTRRSIFLTVTIISLILFIGLPFLDKDFQTTGYATSSLATENRTILLENVLKDMPIKSLLFGLGLSEVNTNKNGNYVYLERLPNDNSFAYYLFTRGILGTILFLLFFLFLILNIQKRKKYVLGTEKMILAGFQVILYIQIGIYFISNSIFQEPRISIVLFTMIGFVLNLLESKSIEQGNE